MIYHFSLSTVALLVGLLYLVVHLPAALRPAWFRGMAIRFPRNLSSGFLWMGGGVIWTTGLCATIDLGEFSPNRPIFVAAAIVLGGLVLALLHDFLAVRGLGVILLLAADVLLDAAFPHNHPLKLLVVTLAYVWIIAGLVFVCTPYRLRDALGYVLKNDERCVLFAWPGVIFGVLLVALGLFVF